MSDSPNPNPPPAPDSITSRASRGFVWGAIQTFGTKVGSVLAQLALMLYVTKADAGLLGIIIATGSFAQVIQQHGLKSILLQRQAHFKTWVHACFWCSAAFSIASFIAFLIAGPISAAIYGDLRIIPPVVLYGLACLLDGAAIIPSAVLEKDMRFRNIAQITLTANLATSILSVILAFAGWGVYAFIVPMPIASLFKTVSLFRVSHYRPPGRLYLERWRFLLPHTIFLIGTGVSLTVLFWADNLTLGRFRGTETAGIYYFAYSLSLQAIQLVTGNLGMVLLPALSKFADDLERQKNACLRAARLLFFIGVPACLLQAILAQPGFDLVFALSHRDWRAAAPVLQILSVGMMFLLTGSCSGGALLAQGRYRFMFLWSCLSAIFFVACVTAGAIFGGAIAVAAAVVVNAAIAYPLALYVAIRPGGGTMAEVLSLYWRPLIAGAIGLAAGLYVQRFFHSPVIQGLLGFLVFAAVIVAVYAVIARKEIAATAAILRDLWNRVTGKLHAPRA